MSIPAPDKDGIRRYGINAKAAEDVTRCAEQVWGRERWPSCYQCNKPRGRGPDGMYCKTHDPAAVNKRRAESEANWKRKMDRDNRPARQRAAYEAALEQIASGHNDPRSLARKTLEDVRGS